MVFWSDVHGRLMTVFGEWQTTVQSTPTLTSQSHKPSLYITPQNQTTRQPFLSANISYITVLSLHWNFNQNHMILTVM